MSAGAWLDERLGTRRLAAALLYRRVPRLRRDEYARRYEESKAEGRTFLEHLVRDGAVMLALLLLASGLALWLGTPLEDKADPLTTTYVPRPEWYFYFLFELLWLFPGKWTVIAAFWIPLLGVLVLLALPFVDRGPARSPFRRPVASVVAMVAIAALLYLTYQGATAPAPPGRAPVAPPRPLAAELERGRQVYEAQGCAACHVIEGAGVPAGPDLSRIGRVRDAEWLRRFVTEPAAVEPRATMPAYKDLPAEDLQVLVGYLASLK